MEQLNSIEATNSLLIEILHEIKNISKQNIIQNQNDTFSIKPLSKASKTLNCCRQTLIKAIKDKKMRLNFDYVVSSNGRYSFSDFIEERYKGKI